MDKDVEPPGVGGGPKGPDAETPRRIALPTVAEGVQRGGGYGKGASNQRRYLGCLARRGGRSTNG